MSNLKLVVTPEAAGDIAQGALWYDSQRPLLGDRFLAEVDRALKRIFQVPLQYAVVDEDVRRAALRKFPYGVYFTVDSTAITVLAVLHHRRHPNTWLRRS